MGSSDAISGVTSGTASATAAGSSAGLFGLGTIAAFLSGLSGTGLQIGSGI